MQDMPRQIYKVAFAHHAWISYARIDPAQYANNRGAPSKGRV